MKSRPTCLHGSVTVSALALLSFIDYALMDPHLRGSDERPSESGGMRAPWLAGRASVALVA